MSRSLFRRTGSIAAAALLASGLMAGNAMADASYVVGSLGSTAWNNLDIPGAGYVGSGSFIDTYDFSIDDMLMVASSVKLDLGFTGSPDVYRIDNLTMTLYDSGNNALGSQTGSPVSMEEPLSAGNYYITISGNADGTQGGLYQFAIAAVPEPGTWVLLLSGLGLIGYISRRRFTSERDQNPEAA